MDLRDGSEYLDTFRRHGLGVSHDHHLSCRGARRHGWLERRGGAANPGHRTRSAARGDGTALSAIWLGFWINAVSGAGLIISDPVGMLTNPLFLTKMLLVAAAVANVVLIQRRVIRSPGVKSGILPSGAKRMAFASLLLWTAATTMGRLTAYLGNQ